MAALALLSELVMILRSTFLVCIALTAAAAERGIAGARSLGMSGAVNASPRLEQAQVTNPAVLAWATAPGHRLQWGRQPATQVGVDIGVGARLRGDLQPLLDGIQDINTNLQAIEDSDLSALETATYISFLDTLVNLDTDTIFIDADAQVLTSAQMGRWAIGANLWVDGTGFVTNADLKNIVLNAVDILIDNLNDNVGDFIDGAIGDYEIKNLTSGQIDELAAAGYSEEAIKALDAILEQSPSDNQDQLVTTIASIPLGDFNDFSNNQTSVTLATLSVIEVPVSYGYEVNEHIAIGGSLKLLYGRSGGVDISVYDEDSGDLILQRFGETKNTFRAAVDLSVLAIWDRIRVGVVGRNLNEPSFPSANILAPDDLVVSRTVVGAIAVDVFEWLTLEVDGDLIPYTNLNGREDRQVVAVGAELRPFTSLALRAGLRANVAEAGFAEEQSTGSLGVGWTGSTFRLEGAVAVSFDDVSYDSYTLPTELQVALGLGARF